MSSGPRAAQRSRPYGGAVAERTTRAVLAVLAAVLLLAGVVSAAVVEPDAKRLAPGSWRPDTSPASPSAWTTSVYRGLGAWIDAYDYGPAYHRPWEGRLLVPEDVDHLADRGVRTLFLQTTRLDQRSPQGIVDPPLVGRFLQRSHERGLRVVAWYLPKFGDLEADLANLRLTRDFEYEGHRFDGLGVDIEWRRDVEDHGERSRRLVELSRRLRQETSGNALAAIVYPPVLLEAVYPGHWPGFPWAELAGIYDAWLPMSYWSETTQGSGYREGYRYTGDSVRSLRVRLGNPSGPVHPVGGVADMSSVSDYQGFIRAARETGAIGWSVYDLRTTSSAGWEVLQQANMGG